MKTRLALLAAFALAAAGCRDNLASIEIFAICGPPEDAEACSTSGTCDSFLASDRPFVQVTTSGFTNRLELFVQVNNQLPNNEDLAAGKVNTNDFIAEEYLFHYRGVPVADVRHPANFTVAADSSTTPVIPLIPEGAMAQIDVATSGTVLVIVEVQVRGHLLDGTEIETGVYEVAVDVVNSNFTPAACPTAGDIRFYCPNRDGGQTSSTSCVAP